MSAGAIGQFFASPTDLVKVQMQMEGKRKLEGKPLRSVPSEAGVLLLLMITLWSRVWLWLSQGKLEEKMGEMVHAGCRSAGKGWFACR